MLNRRKIAVSGNAAQAPCLADWDGDGDYDMAIGFIHGPVKLYFNNGDFTFTEVGPFLADGKQISANDGGPCLVDWDKDGKLDLLLGDQEGRVVFYPGTKRGARELGKGVKLLDSNTSIAWAPRKYDPASRVGFSPGTPGARTKPYAADWNGDGKLDLLVGDYISVEPAPRTFTAAEKAELASLEKKQKEWMDAIRSAPIRAREEAAKKLGKKPGEKMTPAESKKFSALYMQMLQKDKSYSKAQWDFMASQSRMAELTSAPAATGFVWVYLRK